MFTQLKGEKGNGRYASSKTTFSQIAGRHLVAIALFGYISMVPFEQFKYMNIGINNQNLVVFKNVGIKLDFSVWKRFLLSVSYFPTNHILPDEYCTLSYESIMFRRIWYILLLYE